MQNKSRLIKGSKYNGNQAGLQRYITCCKPRFVIQLLLATLSCIQANANIQIINSYQQATKTFADCHAGCLAVFDVDQTLIAPKDPLLTHQNQKLLIKTYLAMQNKQIPALTPSSAKSTIPQSLIADILRSSASIYTEPGIPIILAKLREQGAMVVALTDMTAGSFGNISNLATWRKQQLKELKINFSQNLRTPCHLLIPNATKKPYFASYYSGIIMTEHHAKGPVLMAYLRTLPKQPKKIIFTDDLSTNTQSIQQSCQHHFINCTIFQYTGATKPLSSANRQAVNAKIKYLIKHHQWPNDALIR